MLHSPPPTLPPPDEGTGSRPADLVKGARLGPYEVVSLLGKGGMGEVYRARDPRLDRDVAIKVVAPALTKDDESRRRFEREARAVAALSHPNIVAIHDVGDERGRVFAVTELLEGETLRERLQRGALPWPRAAEIGAAIGDALAAAHAKGLVHRDLKPANVFLTIDERVKVLDFGLAKLTEPAGTPDSEAQTLSRTQAGRLLGTVGYMAPEQAAGRNVDARADIFALGCVLHEMITGQRAFARPTAAETIAAILNEEPSSPATAATTAPAEILRIVSHCLEKSPLTRFQSALDVAFTLRSALAVASAASGPGSLPREAPRARLARAVRFVAGAVLLAASAAQVAWWSSRQAARTLVPAGLARLTWDDGYTAEPALSPDGTLAAYASDRAGAGNLDIWLQHVGGGDPIRLTREPVDERQPSFSPDGARLVFRSEKDGGGLYTIPVLGGEPRLLVNAGYDARYSPDGRSIAYWTGPFVGFWQQPGSYRTFVVDASGGTPREISGFTGARFPIWSPDGRWLLLLATRAQPASEDAYDWWFVPLAGGDAVPTHSLGRLRSAGARVGDETTAGGWYADQLIVSAGDALWSLGLRPGRPAEAVRRLTFGPAPERRPAVSTGGVVAFETSTSMHNVWSLPLDAETGRALGEPARITDGAGPHGRPSISADGRTLAYFEVRARPAVMVKQLDTGRVTDLGLVGTFGPVVSPDGTKVAYPDGSSTGYVVPTRGGQPVKICAGCKIGDWSHDSRHVITDENDTVLRLVDAQSGAGVDLVRAPPGDEVDRPHLSGDDRWLAFRWVDAAWRSFVVVARFTPGSPVPRREWAIVTSGEADVRPCGWSPSGRMLYLVSSRDGFRCLYAQAMDAASGRPQGPPRLVRHFHNIRGTGGGGASVISTGAGNAVLKDRMIFDYPIETANVWTLRLAPGRP